MKQENDDPHFALFAVTLEKQLARLGTIPKNRLEHQRVQMEGLMSAEVMFRKLLVRHRYGEKVYRGFIAYIHDERRNILAARPFYRERVDVFKERISPALGTRNHQALYAFNVNYQFISFCMTRYGRHFGKNSAVRLKAEEITQLRDTIITQNMPLAISRAKIFRRRTPASGHFSVMDCNQVAAEGLVSAVDKFCGPFSRVFRSVIIGRATGNMISNYSDTMLHLYPWDRRKLYRANKARRRTSDLDKIVEEVNIDFPEAMKTNVDEIQQLLNASSHLSLDSPVNGEVTVRTDNAETFSSCAVDQGALPDELVEHKNNVETLMAHTSALTVEQRKTLALSGMLST